MGLLTLVALAGCVEDTPTSSPEPAEGALPSVGVYTRDLSGPLRIDLNGTGWGALSITASVAGPFPISYVHEHAKNLEVDHAGLYQDRDVTVLHASRGGTGGLEQSLWWWAEEEIPGEPHGQGVDQPITMGSLGRSPLVANETIQLIAFTTVTDWSIQLVPQEHTGQATILRWDLGPNPDAYMVRVTD